MEELVTKEQWQALLDSVDTFLFDCDGVLWTGDAEPVPGAQEVLQLLRAKGKAVYFVSNNSSKSREEYLHKLHQQGIQAQEHEMFCTAYIVAYYLKHVLQFTGKVYLMGMPGFAHELELVGVAYTGTGPDHIQGGVPDWLATQLDPEVNAVVVGFDKHFSHSKLLKACSYLKRPSCHFLATNEDPVLPANSDIVLPGTGCFVKSVAWGAGRQPLILGKPNNPMFQVIQQSTGLDPTRTVMIGDRLSTDILFGRRHGLRTLLVLTGSAQRGDLLSVSKEEEPEFFCDSIASLLTCKF